MKGTWKKLLSSTMIATMLVSLLAGCGGKSNAGEGAPAKDGAKPGEKFKISMMYPLTGDAPKKSEALKWMEDKFGVELDLQAVPANGYTEKIRLTVASGDLPDLMVWTAYPDPELRKYVEQGAFRELTDVIGKYSNIMETPEQAFENVKINKKIYSIPRPRPLQGNAVFIRKDWLDNLGLPIPKTTEEYAETAVKFATMDPDQNGKQDTFGIAVGEGLTFLEQLWMAFDTGNVWREMEDGTLQHWDTTPGRKEALGYLADLYSKGALDKDFPVIKFTQVNEKFVAGKMGIMIGSGPTAYGQTVADLKKLNPKAEVIMIDPPVGPTGKFGTPQAAGFYGQWVISSKVSDEKLAKIMEILDWQATQEALDYKRKGIEGVHHKVENGEIVLTDKYKEDGVINLVAHNKYNPYYTTPGAPKEVAQAQLDQWKNIETFGIPNPAVAALTPTMESKIADLDKYSLETFVKIVRGDEPLDTFDTFVEEWKKRGGEQITKEVNEWYKEQK